MTLLLEMKNVHKRYPGVHALKGISYSLRAGELHALVGENGAGKSTLVKVLGGVVAPDEGEILIRGNSARWSGPGDAIRAGVGIIHQELSLASHLTVAENINVVPELLGWSAAKMRSRADELLEMAGLAPERYRYRLPDQLSGGQKQRIGVLRALAADPQVILMDEPFGALDPISRETLQNELVSLQKNLRKTIVFVTHDMDEAIRISDRIAILRKGRVEQIGTPEEIQTAPGNDFIRNFIGEDRLSQMSPDDSVGMLLEEPWAVAAPSESASAVLERMEENDREFIHVVDPKRGVWLGAALLGRVRRAAVAGKSVVESLSRDRKLYLEDAVLRDVAEMLADRDISIPVLDSGERLLGVITSAGLARLAMNRLRGNRTARAAGEKKEGTR